MQSEEVSEEVSEEGVSEGEAGGDPSLQAGGDSSSGSNVFPTQEPGTQDESAQQLLEPLPVAAADDDSNISNSVLLETHPLKHVSKTRRQRRSDAIEALKASRARTRILRARSDALKARIAGIRGQ